MRLACSMSREDFAAAVARGFKSAEKLVISGIMSQRTWEPPGGAHLLLLPTGVGKGRSTRLPASIRGQDYCGANEGAGDQLNDFVKWRWRAEPLR